MYYELYIGNVGYKLKLTTANIIQLEKKIGCSPLAIFGDGSTIPTVGVMVNILHYSLLAYNHSITERDSYELFDRWLEENTLTDFVYVIVEIFKASGLIKSDDKELKN